LNKHIDYSVCCAAIPNDEQARSLALPQGMAVSGDGRTLYVAALGSDKIGVFATAQLAADTFFPDVTRQIAVKGGPTGLVLDEPNRRLYVFTRFDNSVAVIDTRLLSETSRVPLYSPEPDEVITGRRLLYDASFTSSHGDSACASCHVFGDLDSLAWDLGDPDGMTIRNPAPFVIHPNDLCGPLIAINCGADGRPISPNFHPMKGPMTTQSLRGLANHGSMHWRGDRTGGNDAPNVQPDGGTYDERAAFTQFNAAFVDLLGRSRPLATAEMRALTDFVLQMAYPPNPIRRLDNSLTQEQQAGRDFYFGPVSDTFTNCNDCHRLDPQGNRQFGVTRPGFFGADGRTTDDAEFQVFKVPHLRNMYQKVGMFGMARSKFFLPDSFEPEVDNAFMGDQIRGFGFKHDGSVDTVFHLNRAIGFAPRAAGTAGPGDPGNPHGIPLTESGVELNRQIEAFMMAFDTNMPPIVGQQVTLTGDGTDAVRRRIDLLMQQADRGECDLVVKGGVHAAQSSYLYVGGGRFRPDRRAAPLVGDDDLRARAMTSAGELTYTCTPPGSGIRMGLDRDEDGFFDSDETTAGSRSDDPLSHPRR
jgi:hypothetical protein